MFSNIGDISIVYWILFVIMAIGAYSEEMLPYKPRRDFQFIGIWALILISGLRYGMSDYNQYKGVYYLDYFQFEPGYEFLQNIFSGLGVPFEIFVFIFAVISCVFLKKAFSKYWFFWGMLLVLAKLATFYAMSGMRQWMALCICFYAISLLLNGEKLKFVFWVIIAFTFHRSAFIVLPLIFLYKRDFSYTLALIITVLAVIIGYSAKEFLFAAAEASELFDATGYLIDNETGINTLNWIENFAFLAMGLTIRKRVKDKVPHYDFFLYMMLIYCAFLIAGSDFGIIKRLRDYYVLSYYIILPSISVAFRKQERNLINTIIILYFGLLFIRSLDYFDVIARYKCVLFADMYNML